MFNNQKNENEQDKWKYGLNGPEESVIPTYPTFKAMSDTNEVPKLC